MRKPFFSVIAVCLVLLLCIGCTATPTTPSDTADTTDNVSETTTATTETTAEVVESSSINGVELSNFAIVYSDEDHEYSKRAAEYIQTEIRARTGLDLALVEDSAQSTAEYEIVVGETEREISSRLDADTQGTQFAILAEEKQIALEGDYFIIAAAAYFFVETYVPEDNFNASIPTEVSIHEPIVEEAKNFIFLIGDGMGLYQTLLFDQMENDVEYGDGEDVFYGYYFPYLGWARTTSLSGTTDSAAAGTALSSGYKTINGFVGQDSSNNDIMSITELAATLGLSTAVMSTEASTGATPASFSAHTTNRGNSGEILSDQDELTDTHGTIIACDYDLYTVRGVGVRLKSRITNTLDKLSKNDEGFFVMYEEAHIDKHCHSNDMNKAFQAMVRFNQAIGAFMEYAFYNPNTFVLITADHETGSLLPNGNGGFSFNSGDHSSHYVPVFTYGDGGELFDGKIIENIQIPQTIASFMGVTDFGDQTNYQYLTK